MGKNAWQGEYTRAVKAQMALGFTSQFYIEGFMIKTELGIIFKRAEAVLSDVTRRQTDTQEVLVYNGRRKVNFAWRPKSNAKMLQMYPPTKNRSWHRSEDKRYLVVEGAKGTFKYYDPRHELTGGQWSYVGGNVESSKPSQVWLWIQTAYEHAKSIA